jgi:hypothetical protein
VVEGCVRGYEGVISGGNSSIVHLVITDSTPPVPVQSLFETHENDSESQISGFIPRISVPIDRISVPITRISGAVNN